MDRMGPIVGMSIPARTLLQFLNAVLELGDPAILPDELGVIARSARYEAVAEETGLGRESLYKSLSKSGNPRFSTVVNVLDCLGSDFGRACCLGQSVEGDGSCFCQLPLL